MQNYKVILLQMLFSWIPFGLFVVLTSVSSVYSQSITDLPGMNKDIDAFVDQMRDKWQKAYIEPLDQEMDEASNQVDTLHQFLINLEMLNEKAYKIYNFLESPFNSMKTDSEDPESFTASANKNAEPNNHKIMVKQIARGDRFLSDPIPFDRVLPGASFSIGSGEDLSELSFTGGTINDLATVINTACKEKIAACNAYKVDDQNMVLSLSNLKTGKANQLKFNGDLNLLFAIGLLNPGSGEEKAPTTLISDPTQIETIQGDPFNLTDDKILILKPNSQVSFKISKPSKLSVSIKLDMEIMLEKLDRTKIDLNKDRFKVGDINPLTIHKWTLLDNPMIPSLGAEELSEDIRRQFLTLRTRGNRNLHDYQISNEEEDKWIPHSFPIGQDITLDQLDNLLIKNNHGSKLLKIRGIRISDYIEKETPENKPAYHAKNALDKAQDAIVSVDGVDVERPTNTINDIINGVTLYLENESPKEADLKVDHNYDDIVKSLIDFKDFFNLCMQFIYNVSLNYQVEKRDIDRAKEAWKDYSPEQKELVRLTGEYYKFLNALRGDSTLRMIKDRLRAALVAPYETVDSPKISQIIQVGFQNEPLLDSVENSLVFTERGRDALRMGTIEVNEELLKKTLKEHFKAVYQLFVNDTNQDNMPDTGVAYQVYLLTKDFKSRSSRAENGQPVPGVVWVKIEGFGAGSQLAGGNGGLLNKIKELERKKDSKLEWMDRELAETRRKLEKTQNSVREMNQVMKRLDSMAPKQ